MSWTSAFVSLAVVVEERSWLSFARRQGWVERWMFEGREVVMIEVKRPGGWREKW